jgi:hypothetical protein
MWSNWFAVAVTTDAPKTLYVTAAVSASLGRPTRFGPATRQGGLRTSDAKRFAATLIAASEGAVAVSRAEKSLEPFELTAAMLIDQVEHLASRPKRR